MSERIKEDKINGAHAYGGEEMAIKTVEGFLKVPVDHYLKIDFQGFKGIVDAVGGVTVDVPLRFLGAFRRGLLQKNRI